MLLLASFVAVIASLPFIAAQTSLYIPGFDPQPVSADVLGVDSQGRTTWALQPGQPTDTRADSGFSGTVTLVEGPDFASLTYVDPAGQFTMGRVCSLSAGLAICTGVAGTETVVETETASPFEVQVGTTAVAVPPPNPSESSTPSIPSSTPSPGASSAPLPSGPSQTSESNTSSTSTNSANEKTLASYVAMLLGSTGLVVALM